MSKKPAYIKNKKKKNVDYFSIGLFIIIVGVLVYFAYDYSSPKQVVVEKSTTDYTYNGFEFSYEAGIWYTQIEKDGVPYIIMTEYDPLTVENETIFYNANLFPGLTHKGDTVYLSFDPTENNKSDITVAGVDFAKSLSIVYGVNIVATCTQNSTGCAEVVTCNSTNRAVIELIHDDDARAEYDGNCLKVYGRNSNLIKVVNRVMFEWYGIIQVDETGQVI